MAWWVWVVIAAIIVLAVLAAVAYVQQKRRQQRSAELRERFGPEYDRTLKRAGGRRKGEAELEQRLQRRRGLEIGSGSDEMSYAQEWEALQTQFEEAPLPAVARADALVTTVLADRGYPMDSFDQRAADLSVDHPDAVEHYRRAHAALRSADEKGATNEDLYEALQHYRALLEDVVGDGFRESAAPATTEARPQRPPTDEPLPIEDRPTA
jgi:hypothetical protein